MNLTRFARLCGLAALLPVFVAQAADETPSENIPSQPEPSRALLNADGSNNRWNGIGRIISNKGLHCTATLIDTRSPDSPADAPAYALTSGHCLKREFGVILTDEQIEGSLQLDYFADTVARSFPLERIVWSSMQGVDLAIVRLQPTLRSLVDEGFHPLPIADAVPAAGREILWIGAPLYKDAGHLRMAVCAHRPSAEILSGSWVWRRSVSNRCRDVDTGASGSPLLIRETGELYAVVNLVTPPAMSDSTETLPPGFPALARDSVFAMPVVDIKTCFAKGVLITDPAECALFPTYAFRFAPFPKDVGKVRIAEDGREIYPQWNLRFTASSPFYRYKKADSALDCENPAGYGDVTASDNAFIDAPVDTRIGINWLCLIGLTATDERPRPGLMRNALTLAMEVLPAGPTAEPQVTITATPFRTWRVRWDLGSGQIDHYTGKFGPAATTDCSDPQGYRRMFRDLTLRAKALPVKICTYAHDVNGQPSQLREDIVAGAS